MEITKGKCKVEITPSGIDVWSDNQCICIVDTNNDEANAELITEAFNVTNETGKSPRQLADENRDMDKELDIVHGCLTELYNFDVSLPIVKACLDKIEAINRTTK